MNPTATLAGTGRCTVLLPMKIRRAPARSRLVDAALCLGLLLVALALAAVSTLWLEPATVLSPRILSAAYPDAIREIRYETSGWTLRLANGHTAPFSDGRMLPFEERIDRMDAVSIFSQRYPFETIEIPVREYQDPGRLRYYPLLEAAYGASQEEVERDLEPVDFLGVPLRFNRRNGAAEALRRAVREIEADPELVAFLQPIVKPRLNRAPAIGSYNRRLTEGTNRLSTHSYGIAVDIELPESTKPMYWRWIAGKTPDQFEYTPEVATLPEKLVRLFEKHGFIWGGKWHHFDTMHFEYRPEFLAQERVLNMGWKAGRESSRSRRKAPKSGPPGEGKVPWI